MSNSAVDEIWNRIHALSEEDRLVFAREWSRWVEEQWRSNSQEARKAAAEEGLDDAAIARAVEEVRYGK